MTHLLDAALLKGLAPGIPLRIQLEQLGVSLTRINAAVRDAGELGAEKSFARAIQFEKNAEETFVEQALKPWAERHGITVGQAISILSNDSKFNPVTQKDDLPSAQDIHAWLDQKSGFFQRISAQNDDHPVMPASRVLAFLSANYSENPEEALAQMLAKLPPSRATDALAGAIEKLRASQAESPRFGPRP